MLIAFRAQFSFYQARLIIIAGAVRLIIELRYDDRRLIASRINRGERAQTIDGDKIMSTRSVCTLRTQFAATILTIVTIPSCPGTLFAFNYISCRVSEVSALFFNIQVVIAAAAYSSSLVPGFSFSKVSQCLRDGCIVSGRIGDLYRVGTAWRPTEFTPVAADVRSDRNGRSTLTDKNSPNATISNHCTSLGALLENFILDTLACIEAADRS